MKRLHCVTFVLLVVGGLNWLLVGLLQWGIGDFFGGNEALVSRSIYVLVGISALYEVAIHRRICKKCDKDKGGD